MKQIILIQLIILSTIFQPVFGNSSNETIDYLEDKMNESLRYGNYSGSEYYANEILKLDTNNTVGLVGLGNVYYRLGDLEKSSQHYNQALKLNSTDPNVLRALGNYNYRNGDYETATEYFKSMIETGDDQYAYPNAMMGIANVYQISKQYENAIAINEIILSKNPEDKIALTSMIEIYSEFCNNFQDLGRYIDAEPDCQKVDYYKSKLEILKLPPVTDDRDNPVPLGTESIIAIIGSLASIVSLGIFLVNRKSKIVTRFMNITKGR